MSLLVNLEIWRLALAIGNLDSNLTYRLRDSGLTGSPRILPEEMRGKDDF